MGPWVISFPSLLLANLYWYFQKRGSPLLPDAASFQQFFAHQRKGFIFVIWQRFLTHCKQFGFLSFGNNLLPNEKKSFIFFAFGKVFMLGPHQCWALQLLTSFLLIKNRFGLRWYMCWLVYFHLHPIGNLQILYRFLLFRCASISSTYPCMSVGRWYFWISILSESLVALREKLKKANPNYF